MVFLNFKKPVDLRKKLSGFFIVFRISSNQQGTGREILSWFFIRVLPVGVLQVIFHKYWSKTFYDYNNNSDYNINGCPDNDSKHI